MAKRLPIDRLPDWPARMRSEIAAAYLDISASKFLTDVAAKKWPQPEYDGARHVWHRVSLDRALAERRGEHDNTGNTIMEGLVNDLGSASSHERR